MYINLTKHPCHKTFKVNTCPMWSNRAKPYLSGRWRLFTHIFVGYYKFQGPKLQVPIYPLIQLVSSFSALKMEAPSSSKAVAPTYQTTRHYITKDCTLKHLEFHATWQISGLYSGSLM
jgi:hypothetical protein